MKDEGVQTGEQEELLLYDDEERQIKSFDKQDSSKKTLYHKH